MKHFLLLSSELYNSIDILKKNNIIDSDFNKLTNDKKVIIPIESSVDFWKILQHKTDLFVLLFQKTNDYYVTGNWMIIYNSEQDVKLWFINLLTEDNILTFSNSTELFWRKILKLMESENFLDDFDSFVQIRIINNLKIFYTPDIIYKKHLSVFGEKETLEYDLGPLKNIENELLAFLV